MKSFNCVIIRADQDYNNEVNLNGTNIIINTTIESVSNINRQVTVVSAPDFTVLQKGDDIIIHHNILRRKNDIKGKEIKSDYFVKDDLYFVPLTEIFAYKRNGEWKSLDPYVFCKPIKIQKEKSVNNIVYIEEGHKGYEKNVGHIKYLNKELIEWGVREEDKVFFKDDSEYEFEIEGELLYRMRTSDILGKFE